jgi:hypothetical protein
MKMKKLMMNHEARNITAAEAHAIEIQMHTDRSEQIRRFVQFHIEGQLPEEVNEMPTSSSQPQRYQVKQGQANTKAKAPPPELFLEEPKRVPRPPKMPPPIAPQESATPKLQGSSTSEDANPIRFDGRTRVIIDLDPLTPTEVSPYKEPPMQKATEAQQLEMRIRQMSSAVYEKRVMLSDGTSAVVKGFHKVLIKAVVSTEGTPTYKVPPKGIPLKAIPEGTIEEALVKAPPTKSASMTKAPPLGSIPFPVWNAKSPPPKQKNQKDDGLS